MFDVGVRDDTLGLIYKANKEIQMAVKTPSGLTDRETIENIVLQGDTWGSIMELFELFKLLRLCYAVNCMYSLFVVAIMVPYLL